MAKSGCVLGAETCLYIRNILNKSYIDCAQSKFTRSKALKGVTILDLKLVADPLSSDCTPTWKKIWKKKSKLTFHRFGRPPNYARVKLIRVYD